MRPEKFDSLMSKGIDEWLRSKSNHLLIPLLPEMKRVWKKYCKDELAPFTITGEEEYGGCEEIYNHFHYISDRWRVSFRLRWLIDGLEKGYL